MWLYVVIGHNFMGAKRQRSSRATAALNGSRYQNPHRPQGRDIAVLSFANGL